MCADYWNLRDVPFTCPRCNENVSANLQTHFMGDMSFDQHYRIGEAVPLLGDMTVTLGKGGLDRFIGTCPECDEFLDFGARIVLGAVVEAWPL